jgi:polysaccharide chain length determinant protein (PEP-CTERM system associated)
MPRDMLTPTHDDSLVLRALDILRRRKLLTMIVFTAVMTSAVSFALYLPDLYRGTAVVLVERQMPESFVRSAVTGELDSRLHVIRQQMLSRARLTEIINQFDLYPKLRREGPIEDALDQMRHDVTIEATGPEQVSGRKTTVAFMLSYTGANGSTVADVANTLADFYVDQNFDIRSGQASRTTEFLKEQLDEARTELDRREAAIRAYTAAHPGELPQQVEVNLAALERMNTQLRLNGERQLKVLEDRERLARGVTAITIGTSSGETVSIGSPAAARLEQMKKELQALEGRFTSRHPDVVRLRAEIAAQERDRQDALVRQAEGQRTEPAAAAAGTGSGAAGGGTAAGAAPADSDATAALTRRRTVEGLDAELARLRAEEDTLRQNIATYEQRLENVPAREQEFERITQDYRAAKDLYDSLLKRYDEAALGASMETEQQGERFVVLEAAAPPPGPVAPNRPRLLIVGLMLAIAAAAVAALMAEQFDTTFHNVDAIREFTSVPVLATIPDIGTGTGGRALRVAMATVSVIAVIALSAVMSAHFARGNERIVWMLSRGA